MKTTELTFEFKVSDWANWIARDIDGTIWEYEVEPTRRDCCWAVDSGQFNMIGAATRCSGESWRDSLYELEAV